MKALINPPNVCSIENILIRDKYSFELKRLKLYQGFVWEVILIPCNGKGMSLRRYKNKAQARNVWKKFANATGIKWIESY